MKFKIRKESLREQIQKSKITRKEFQEALGLNKGVSDSMLSTGYSRIYMEEEEIEQIIDTLNHYENEHVVIKRKEPVTYSDIVEK